MRMTVGESRVPDPPVQPRPLSRLVLAAYSAPSFSQAFIHGPAVSVLQGIYGKYFGLGLEQIALVVVISRIFDAVTDPVIGVLSDRYRTRHGSRKPWLLVGSAIAIVACWFLYVPAGEVTTFSFLFWYLLASLGWTISEVPYGAWLAELSEDYDERARIASWRGVGRYLGLIAFFGLPLAASPFLGSTEFTPDSLRWSAAFASVAMTAAVLIAVARVPNGVLQQLEDESTLGESVRAVVRNKPLLYFAAMYALAGLANGIPWGLVFFYVDGYLKLGEQFAGLLVISIPIAIVATPVWGWLCRRFGKQQAWAAGCTGCVAVSASLAFISPGPWAAITLTVALLVFNALVVAEWVAGPAILADVVDFGRWRFGADYAGTYFSFYTMVQKINMGIGAGIGLSVAAAFGFDATLETRTPGGIFGLLFAYAWIPAGCFLAAAAMIWRFPINRRRQRAIVRALERRQQRAVFESEPGNEQVT